MNENLLWDHRFVALAQHISLWSKDPSTKVGAVIVRPNKTIASVGYNGFPRGVDDSPSLYENREIKYARVVHAELNAILNSPERPEGYTIYTHSCGWGPACSNCAAAIIQSGIVRVVYDLAPVVQRAQTSINAGLKMFYEAGIQVKGIIS